MDATIEHELLSAVKDLSSREVQLVIDYAKTLHLTPISEVGQAYLEILVQKGASPTELLRAAQAVQRVEERSAQGTPQETLYDLEQRTRDKMQTWFKEHGLDYNAVVEEQFDEIVNTIIHQHRQAR
jgi:hypothetical protein